MSDTSEIGIGLLGMGVVGSEVARNLLLKADRLAQQVGRPLRLRGILVRDKSRRRDPAVPPALLTTDPEDLVARQDVHVVVEVMGGLRPAYDLIRSALSQDKHVVTANKEVMATHGPELVRLAEEQEVSLLYEASVGGGIPLIGPLHKDLLANEVSSLHAIINGTTNYILTRMSQEGASFQTALRQAQELGYAEANPANDVEGADAAYKLAILASLAFHSQVTGAQVYREGIARLSAVDFRYAQELGYAIKLLAIARREDTALSLRVHPCLVPEEHLLAKVDGVFNAIEVEGDLVGKVVFHGQGAGAKPTASAILGDILEVACNIASGRKPAHTGNLKDGLSILPIEELVTQYYLRVTVSDSAGVLAKIATVLGDLGISIASVIQKAADAASQTAELVIMTHPAKEAYVRQAVQQMKALDVVREVGNVIRVEQQA
ncbi:MAG: homoserine dehydrogenase [Chloroflexi bacterium]|nr:homoserine dehydrogenase [Chloroflexota bacterium]